MISPRSLQEMKARWIRESVPIYRARLESVETNASSFLLLCVACSMATLSVVGRKTLYREQLLSRGHRTEAPGGFSITSTPPVCQLRVQPTDAGVLHAASTGCKENC